MVLKLTTFLKNFTQSISSSRLRPSFQVEYSLQTITWLCVSRLLLHAEQVQLFAVYALSLGKFIWIVGTICVLILKSIRASCTFISRRKECRTRKSSLRSNSIFLYFWDIENNSSLFILKIKRLIICLNWDLLNCSIWNKLLSFRIFMQSLTRSGTWRFLLHYKN